MKIYTKTGDEGQTGLPGGLRVSKDHQVVEVCGTVDELNSMLGLVRAGDIPEDVGEVLAGIQTDLFDLCGRVAMCLAPESGAVKPKLPELLTERIAIMERAIDRWQEQLPPLTMFILPDGGVDGCRVHLGRAICRRAERQLVSLQSLLSGNELSGENTGEADPATHESGIQMLDIEQVFLNRLSDLLFVAARLVNQHLGRTETLWTPAKK